MATTQAAQTAQTAADPQPSPSPSQPPRQSFDAIALEANSRGLALGGTGSGKTTLEEVTIADWRRRYGDAARVLVFDSKPRFRAEWQLNGLSTRRLYKQWGHGQPLAGSVLLPLEGDPAGNLKQAWRLGHTAGVVQVDRVRGLDDLPWLLAYMRAFFGASDRRKKQLAVVDEAADYFSSSGAFGRGHPMVQIARSGREVGCALFASSQRPRGLPPSLMTEATQLYLFQMDKEKDWEPVYDIGYPEELTRPGEDHQFRYYHKRRRTTGLYKLGGIGASGGGGGGGGGA